MSDIYCLQIYTFIEDIIYTVLGICKLYDVIAFNPI